MAKYTIKKVKDWDYDAWKAGYYEPDYRDEGDYMEICPFEEGEFAYNLCNEDEYVIELNFTEEQLNMIMNNEEFKQIEGETNEETIYEALNEFNEDLFSHINEIGLMKSNGDYFKIEIVSEDGIAIEMNTEGCYGDMLDLLDKSIAIYDYEIDMENVSDDEDSHHCYIDVPYIVDIEFKINEIIARLGEKAQISKELLDLIFANVNDTGVIKGKVISSHNTDDYDDYIDSREER